MGRNLMGLCGDMSGEKTADVKSAKQCIMSSPKLAAYSFMVEDRKCAGIPSAEKEKFQREEADFSSARDPATGTADLHLQEAGQSMWHRRPAQGDCPQGDALLLRVLGQGGTHTPEDGPEG